MLADGIVRKSRRRDDQWTLVALRFLTDLRGCRDEADHEALVERMPDVHAAYAVFADAAPQGRWALEAYILSGESFGTIAGRYGVGEGTIAAYERLFFDVVDHVDTDYVSVVAIGLQSGPAPPGLGATWRWFAFHGGPLVLEFLLGTNSDPDKLEHPGRLDAFTQDHVRDELLRKVAIAALTLPADARSAPKLIGLYLRALVDGRRARGSAPTLEAITPNVAAMWDCLPQSVKARIEPSA